MSLSLSLPNHLQELEEVKEIMSKRYNNKTMNKTEMKEKLEKMFDIIISDLRKIKKRIWYIDYRDMVIMTSLKKYYNRLKHEKEKKEEEEEKKESEIKEELFNEFPSEEELFNELPTEEELLHKIENKKPRKSSKKINTSLLF